ASHGGAGHIAPQPGQIDSYAQSSAPIDAPISGAGGSLETSSGHYQVADAGYGQGQSGQVQPGIEQPGAGHTGAGHTGAGHTGAPHGGAGHIAPQPGQIDSYAQSSAPIDAPISGSPDMTGTEPAEPSSGHYRVSDSGYVASSGEQPGSVQGSYIAPTGDLTGGASGAAGSPSSPVDGYSYGLPQGGTAPIEPTPTTQSGPGQTGSAGEPGASQSYMRESGMRESGQPQVDPGHSESHAGMSHDSEPGAAPPASDPAYDGLMQDGHHSHHHAGDIDSGAAEQARLEAVAREQQMRAEMEYRRSQALDAQHGRPPGFVPLPIPHSTRQRPASQPSKADAGKKSPKKGGLTDKLKKSIDESLTTEQDAPSEPPQKMDNIQPQASGLEAKRKSTTENRLRSALGRAGTAPPVTPEPDEDELTGDETKDEKKEDS
ncbi:MAG: hypothetical protein K8F91_19165, partial [Candidatus Obscuribacterales bacterium]|nr:hypothetical protein [Candidatus Obscuribacterales bacterium]